MRLVGPIWRYLGAALSWWLFVLCFTLLYRGAATVMGLGGFCASGGPYEIEVECPAEVVATVPLSIFGGLLAAGVALALARGFAAPLIGWAWPILFVGLGIAFTIAGVTVEGGWSNLVIAVLFVAMGLVPLVLTLRAAPRALFLGWTRADDRPFASEGERSSVVMLPATRRPLSATGEPVSPTPVDWVVALGVPLVAALLGVWTASAILGAITASAS